MSELREHRLGRQQVRELDRRATEEYGLSGAVLMENAGRGAVDVLCRLGIDGPVVIVCGGGNNGGDGLVMARHLDLRGHTVRVLLLKEPHELRGDAAINCRIAIQSQLPLTVVAPDTLPHLPSDGSSSDWASVDGVAADWIVDAVLGTGARGAVREPLASVIRAMNAAAGRKLAVDLPSGLDCDSGVPGDPTFRADYTCTFVAPKRGFAHPAATELLGTLHVLDIGAPRQLVEQYLPPES